MALQVGEGRLWIGCPARRVLVTGGAGFIGSHLVDRLVADGHRVAVVDDLSSGRRDRVPSDVALHVADVVDADAVTGVVTACQPDVIYHLAAQISVRYSVANPVADATTNILGTMNLLNAAIAAGARLILASTGGAMYGDDVPLPTPETCSPGTHAPYGIAKYCAEQYLMLFNRLHGGRHIALRLGNAYGPRQDPHGEAGVVAIFCGQVARGETPAIYGDGKQTRDYIYVADVVDAFIAATQCRVMRRCSTSALATPRASSISWTSSPPGRATYIHVDHQYVAIADSPAPASEPVHTGGRHQPPRQVLVGGLRERGWGHQGGRRRRRGRGSL
ncbi:MAG TPA: NAD-dependent epimerase/dehydratase family protein [Pseudonocardiaceae bacterium]|nr:NAD-dependent epimerase/dehydratase family protein [Pseudonocardiaceae bacterium]